MYRKNDDQIKNDMSRKQIQVISCTTRESDAITYSTFSAPRSLDEFDINIINLGDEQLWYEEDMNCLATLNEIDNLHALGQMVIHSSKTIIVYIFPQDIKFYHVDSYSFKNGINSRNYLGGRWRDQLKNIQEEIFPKVIDGFKVDLAYENTRTIISDESYCAAFYFLNSVYIVTESDLSYKPTTIKTNDRIFLTTLDLLVDEQKLLHFIYNVVFPVKKEKRPEWMNEIYFFDDKEQQNIIEEHTKQIKRAKQIIDESNEKLQTNNRYKSIVYTTGDELVEVVLDIMSQMLEYDLSSFVDEKKEDFLIRKDTYTLIGEIKGISSNVRSEHVSQIDTHYHGYLDKLVDEGRKEEVKQLLIINPLRKIPLNMREGVHETQIELAKRNGCLIVETKALLKMYESYLHKELTPSDCEKIFTTNKGLLIL